ncbi:MAG: PSD1 domain-containing protein [Planctomycetales bacterium]|nr:PSD1 domain-containing protein [Planctomycetales bacterium]
MGISFRRSTMADYLRLAFVVFVASPICSASPPDTLKHFSTVVEPLLKKHCYACHSHAAGVMEGNLTLDSHSGWQIGGDRGPAILPGDIEKSLFVRVIQRVDDDLAMPPDDALPHEVVETLVDWIRQGAVDPREDVTLPQPHDARDWWSLRPLRRPSIPAATRADAPCPLNPIDKFIEAKQAEAGITGVPLADRRTLIRRLTFDLLGRLPTASEVDEFCDDQHSDAYARLVDRLLASPQYGQRWARHWLDTAHFADSHGCEHDVFRPQAWQYRDYVIDRLNADVSWPRFLREQLAADVLYPDQPQLVAALGFLGAGPLELSRAGTAPVTFDYLDRDDMVTQIMAAVVSTTANCARCHTHKFDPITQEDYYALQAVFAGVGKGDVAFDPSQNVARERQYWQHVLLATKNPTSADFAAVMRDSNHQDLVFAWETKTRNESASWQVLHPDTFTATNGTVLKRLSDHSLLATGPRPEKDIYSIGSNLTTDTLTAIRLDVLVDDSFPLRGPGRADNGNLHLTEFEAYLFSPQADSPLRLPIEQASADWDQDGWTIQHALDGDEKTAWGIYPQVGHDHYAVMVLNAPVAIAPQSRLVIQLKQLHGGSHLLGRIRLSVTNDPRGTAIAVPPDIQSILDIPVSQREAVAQSQLAAFVLRHHAQHELAQLPSPSQVYAVSPYYSRGTRSDIPTPPKVVLVLQRGDIDKPGEVAQPGALSVFDELADHFCLAASHDESDRRKALADWFTDHDQPLMWRSIANRVWHHHFGTGLCDTPNDFGRMGAIPTHPELLDWLAVWFRDDAHGSLKELHRLIVMSHTYQQQSDVTGEDTAIDPQVIDAGNRLLWRMNRRRLDAESYRDSVLQLAGRLDASLGGPGIQQFVQTPGPQSTPKLDYEAFDWQQPAATRRSIYRVVWRGIPDPFMESLDFPDLGIVPDRRNFSVSSLQSLVLLNNRFVLHHAEAWAAQLEASSLEIGAQITLACQQAFYRDPLAGEKDDWTAYVMQHGLPAFCRILLNSNEFLFVD